MASDVMLDLSIYEYIYYMFGPQEASDVIKLQLHLSLLKDEYVKLQNYCSDLERKYSLAIAKHGEVNENGFLSKLLKIVGGLFNQDHYSDIKVKLDGQLISAHRFVLSARSESWGVTSLFHADLLDWSMLNPDVGRAVLKWVYTDEVDFFDGDKFTLDLMCTANEFKLDELVTKCEKVLIASANIKNCISLYTTACQMGANFLKEHCSGLISAHWNDFTPADFSSMNSALLFDVLKSQTNFPLHSAIRLHRDDVVFLFLIAFNNEHETYKLGQPTHRAFAPVNPPIEYSTAPEINERHWTCSILTTEPRGRDIQKIFFGERTENRYSYVCQLSCCFQER
uniref:BTB domain-containing protein n=1 Tax=Timema monikensis TaxID=170555 RepID=A0A7R9E1Q3_9NEOP|nr:unnamed protein product [Timema monikensis]